MKVFVAGASEAVGRRMIPRLLAAGHAVVAMTRDSAKAEPLERAARAAGVSRLAVERMGTWDRPDDPGAHRGPVAVATLDAHTPGSFKVLGNELAFASDASPSPQG